MGALSYDTNIAIYDFTPDYVWGNPLNFTVEYNYTSGGSETDIDNATINYKIQYRGETINDTTFTQSGENGEYEIYLDIIKY